jgi:hypothetical protein
MVPLVNLKWLRDISFPFDYTFGIFVQVFNQSPMSIINACQEYPSKHVAMYDCQMSLSHPEVPGAGLHCCLSIPYNFLLLVRLSSLEMTLL